MNIKKEVSKIEELIFDYAHDVIHNTLAIVGEVETQRITSSRENLQSYVNGLEDKIGKLESLLDYNINRASIAAASNFERGKQVNLWIQCNTQKEQMIKRLVEVGTRMSGDSIDILDIADWYTLVNECQAKEQK